MKILAHAKLNLTLDILSKDASGYHKIQTVFHEIPDLSDGLEILSTKNSDHMSIVHTPDFPNPNRLPKTTDNLAYKALLLVKTTFSITDRFAQIKIIKKIPISSGLGGAASDAAAVLKGLNNLWNLQLSQKELLKLASQLGKDVPFFIIGGTALGENHGEILTPLNPIQNIHFKINAQSSPNPEKTKNAYSKIDLVKCGQSLDKTKKLLAAIENEDTANIIDNLHNDFEQLYPADFPAKKHHLSGSGPSTFSVQK